MTPGDLLRYALGNLARMKLRAGLTVAGVTIGVGMMVSMLGFGVGMQRNVRARFEQLGLFETILILPGATPAADDPAAAPPLPLDDALVSRVRGVPGVATVYPFEAFSASLEVHHARRPVTVSAVPDARAVAGSGLEAGRFFAGGAVRELLVKPDLVRRFGYQRLAAIVDTPATLITTKSNLAELARRGQELRAGLGLLNGLRTMGEILRLLDEAARSPFSEVRYAFTVVGVLSPDMGQAISGQVMIPIGSSSEIEHLGFSTISELAGGGQSRGQYSMLMVRTRSLASAHEAVETLRGLRLNVMSFAEQFDEVRKAMLLFDLFVAAIALVAVVVAALGIINTLVMAIVERTREIGVLKSLGAEEGHIRVLFLAEAGVMGLAGGLLGDGLGFLVTRAGSAVAKYVMARQGVPQMEVFHTPWWLLLFGLLFGAGVSLVAGVYPAHRAARIDPVQALRHD